MNIRLHAFTALAMVIGCADAGAATQPLAQRIAQQDGWVGYQVALNADGGVPCCYNWHGKHSTATGCELEGGEWNLGMDDNASRPAAGSADALDVFIRVAHGKVDRIRAYAASCPVRGREQARWLDNVDAKDSIALLTSEASAATSRKDDDEALLAMALHADASATAALAGLSGSGHPRKLREQSLFWLGQMRGADGARAVEHAATTDGDPELRAHAVFALSQAKAADGYAAIHRIALSDMSEHVREQSLFWMAQMGDARAKDDIIAAIHKDVSPKVREQAVFALSQLKQGDADAALIAVVRGDYPREVKQQALFWLGQSGSDQAMDFLDQVLSKTPAKG